MGSASSSSAKKLQAVIAISTHRRVPGPNLDVRTRSHAISRSPHHDSLEFASILGFHFECCQCSHTDLPSRVTAGAGRIRASPRDTLPQIEPVNAHQETRLLEQPGSTTFLPLAVGRRPFEKWDDRRQGAKCAHSQPDNGRAFGALSACWKTRASWGATTRASSSSGRGTTDPAPIMLRFKSLPNPPGTASSALRAP